MDLNDSIEMRTRNCSICGDHIGAGFDHSECSKLKQEIYAGESENKNPRKKLSKKHVASLGRYFSGIDH